MNTQYHTCISTDDSVSGENKQPGLILGTVSPSLYRTKVFTKSAVNEQELQFMKQKSTGDKSDLNHNI